MARLILTLFGAALLATGLWLSVLWWDTVRLLLAGALALGLVLLGLLVLVFGISELTGARAPKASSVPGRDE